MDLEKRALEMLPEEVRPIALEQLKRKDWGGFLILFPGHSHIVNPMWLVWERASDEEAWKLLGETFNCVEFTSVDKEVWVSLFNSDRPGRRRLMTRREWRVLEGLPDEIKIYRGYRKGYTRSGISWTLSEEKARWFATTYGRRTGPGMLASGVCSKKDVLALFLSRKEREVVVDPRNIREMRSRPV